MSTDALTIAVLCRNEAKTLRAVLADARRAVPGSRLPVIDNASTDGSGDIAREAGARVVFVPEPGFGNAWRTLLTSVEMHHPLPPGAAFLPDGRLHFPVLGCIVGVSLATVPFLFLADMIRRRTDNDQFTIPCSGAR